MTHLELEQAVVDLLGVKHLPVKKLSLYLEVGRLPRVYIDRIDPWDQRMTISEEYRWQNGELQLVDPAANQPRYAA